MNNSSSIALVLGASSVVGYDYVRTYAPAGLMDAGIRKDLRLGAMSVSNAS